MRKKKSKAGVVACVSGEPDTQALRPCIQSRTMCGPEAARKLWVEALRSGRYQQHRHSLSDIKKGDCCLGVACKVYIEAGGVLEQVPREDMIGYGKPGGGYEFFCLPTVVQEWLGLKDPRGVFGTIFRHTDTLASRNDSGSSFLEIAALIESAPFGLLR